MDGSNDMVAGLIFFRKKSASNCRLRAPGRAARPVEPRA